MGVIDIEPIRERFSAVAPFLDERGRRLVAAAEAFAAGYGGIAAVAIATGVAPSTIGRGLKELAQDEPSERIRRPGAGRKRTVSKDPTLLPDLEVLVEPTTRGDPESPLRWTCKSLRRLAQVLQAQGHAVSRTLVGHLLNEAGYSLQGNRKTTEDDSKGLGRAVPYGIYDLATNSGWVSVGVDHDTAAFAVNSIPSRVLRTGAARH